jgi:hypothetical protein
MALGASVATKRIRMTVRGGVVSFSGVPVASLAPFAKTAKTLLGVKLPADEGKPAASRKRNAPR